MSDGNRQNITVSRAIGLLAALTILGAVPAFAQGWQWPWEQQERRKPPPRPSEPMYRPQPNQGYGAPSFGNRRSAICLQLEQRLAQEVNRGAHARSKMPEIEKGIREARQTIRTGEARLERYDCFEYFLFSKTLRQSRRCIKLNRSVEQARAQLSRLESSREAATGSRNRSYRDDIIRELANNNCGQTYEQQARRMNPFGSFWQDEDSGPLAGANRFNQLPFATYRTICVRLCDGYYFPVSFSTLPNHFTRDAEVCQSKCAAPSELYFHQNPGAGIDQAMSHKTNQPYSGLKTAFKYRKEFVKGCSCKASEYAPSDGQIAGADPNQRAQAPGGGGRQIGPFLRPQR